MKKVEVTKQVRLSPAQKTGLIAAMNNGGRLASNSVTFEARESLRWLGLIEERPRCTAVEKKDIGAKIAAAWKELAVATRLKQAERAERILRDLRSWRQALKGDAWWITKAGRECLTLGRVMVVAGPKGTK